jgi:hypothetical protein
MNVGCAVEVEGMGERLGPERKGRRQKGWRRKSIKKKGIFVNKNFLIFLL